MLGLISSGTSPESGDAGHTPPLLLGLLRCCWDKDPTRRPSISSLCDSMKIILYGLTSEQSVPRGTPSTHHRSDSASKASDIRQNSSTNSSKGLGRHNLPREPANQSSSHFDHTIGVLTEGTTIEPPSMHYLGAGSPRAIFPQDVEGFQNSGEASAVLLGPTVTAAILSDGDIL